MTTQPATIVVLVNWKGASDTIECLASLLDLEPAGALIVAVVDNASPDDSIERITAWMAAQGPIEDCDLAGARAVLASKLAGATSVRCGTRIEIALLRNHSNAGFAAANNIGLEFGLHGRGADFAWILNNDTTVDSKALLLLQRRMAADPTIGICGATLLHAHGGGIVQAYGGVRYSHAFARGWHIGAGDVFGGAIDNAAIERQLTYVSGASMFVSRAFVERVGPMSEDYFLYNEELDWSWRALGTGFRLGVETAAVVHHKEGASIGTESIHQRASLLSDFYQTRNKLLFAARFTPQFLPTVWLSLVARAAKRWLGGQRRNAWLMTQVLAGRRSADPKWFTKG